MNISSIDENVFSKLTSLRTLYLNDNNIDKLNQGNFFNLQNLEKLVISKNKIRTIENLTFNNLFNLRELHLDQNNLKNLSEIDFYCLNLRYIDLCGNQIDYINEINCNNFTLLKRTWENVYNFTQLDCEFMPTPSTPKDEFVTTIRNNVSDHSLHKWKMNLIVFLISFRFFT
jgi:hypothetical protein